MSHFSSILGSLGGSPTPPAINASSSSIPPRPRPAATSAQPPSTTRGALPAGVKRKHDELVATSSPAQAQQSSNRPGIPSTLATTNTARLQLHSLGRPDAAQARRPGSKPGTPSPIPAALAPAPPPKGSYRETLLRAQAGQAKPSDFGQIKHKPVQKPVRHGRSQTPEGGGKAKISKDLARSPGKKVSQPGRDVKGKAAAGAMPTKPKRPPLDLGYKGTMRPSAPSPMRDSSSRSPANAISRPKPSSSHSGTRLPERSRPLDKSGQQRPTHLAHREKQYRYADEDGDEDEYDDDSGSEDMGGGGFDELMEEEERSSRAARQEDIEEMRLEARLKREKAEKRAALQRLADARRAKSGG